MTDQSENLAETIKRVIEDNVVCADPSQADDILREVSALRREVAGLQSKMVEGINLVLTKLKEQDHD